MEAMRLNFETIQYMEFVAPALERLEAAGHRAYLVGGCVRELLRQEIITEGEKTGECQEDKGTSGRQEGEGTGGCQESEGTGGCPKGEVSIWRESAESTGNTDIDVATSARPEEVKEVFSDLTVIETGIRHGTLTVMVPLEGDSCRGYRIGERSGDELADTIGTAHRLPIEVTTFRSDGEYSDGRHPDNVSFVGTVEEDLARRDLTINAMAMDIRGEITDPFGGREDLARGIIRTVGDPGERFREDGLRILRTLRFASTLGFDIEDKTTEALHLHRELLRCIAAERIFVELKKLLAGEGAGRILREYADVIEVVIPEMADMEGFEQHNPYHSYDVLEHCIRAMETVETTPENREYMMLAALLHDIGKPSTFSLDEEGIGHFYGHPAKGEEICRHIMNRLRSDRYTKDRVCTLIKYHDLLFEQRDSLIKRWLRRFGPELLLEILALKRADNIATGNASDELIEMFDRIAVRICELVDEEECFRIGDLAINGRDLLDAGIAEGPMIGEILDRLLEAVMDGRIENDRRALLEEAGRICHGSTEGE